MVRKSFPDGPWEHLAIDFKEKLPNKQTLLVVVDYFSRFVEVEFMTNASVTETILRLKRIFSRLGIPKSIRADNGPQFISKQFKQFCNSYAILLEHSPPYWPQANGEVERQNRSLEKRLQIAYGAGKDLSNELSDYLLMYHSTIHSTTGETPTELMFGRNNKDKLPVIRKQIEDFDGYREMDRLNKKKGRVYSDQKRNATKSNIKPGDQVFEKTLIK